MLQINLKGVGVGFELVTLILQPQCFATTSSILTITIVLEGLQYIFLINWKFDNLKKKINLLIELSLL